MPRLPYAPPSNQGTRDGLAGGIATMLLLLGTATGDGGTMLILMFVGLIALTVIYRGRLAYAVWAFLIALGVAFALSLAMRGMLVA